MLHGKCIQHFIDEPGAKMHRLCTIGVSADRTVNSARLTKSQYCWTGQNTVDGVSKLASFKTTIAFDILHLLVQQLMGQRERLVDGMRVTRSIEYIKINHAC